LQELGPDQEASNKWLAGAFLSLASLALLSRRSSKTRVGGGGRGLPVLALVCVAFLLSPGGASAHNWMHTKARANMEASPTKPCRGRKSTDTHAQVGPGQVRETRADQPFLRAKTHTDAP
jgi:hypothetical protein